MDSIDENCTMTTDTEVCISGMDYYNDQENVGLIFGLIVCWLITLATIFGNCLVLISFAINRKIRSKPANVFILTLSLADLTIGIVSLPSSNLEIQYGYWAFGEILCKSYLFFDYTACAVSAGCIILLSLDRYWMVKKHLSYNAFMTHRKAFALSLCLVLFFGIFYALSILFWEIITGENNIDYSEECEVEGINNKIFVYMSITLEFVLPFALLVYLNVNVFIEVFRWSSGKNLQRGINCKIKSKTNKDSCKTYQEDPIRGQKNENSYKNPCKFSSFRRIQGTNRGSQTRKAAITLAALVTAFVICWLPFNISIIIETHNRPISNFAWEFVNYLLWLNSGINPILYAATNNQFRQTFARIIFCRRNVTTEKHVSYNNSRTIKLESRSISV